MQNFHALMDDLTKNGLYKPNRTGTSAYASVGHMLKFDLREAFPAPTTKKAAFKSFAGEFLAFFRGYDNAADFRALGCNFWDQNANETESWLKNPNRKGTDDLGAIYGVLWTKWRDTRIVPVGRQANALEAAGYELMAFDPVKDVCVYERTINQLEEALRTLLTDPYNRRILVTGWCPDMHDRQSLPSCHLVYSFVAQPDNTLHCTMFMRSADVFLGVPANIMNTAMFTHIMARLCGREAATITVFMSDTHLYENHIEQAKEQLSREHLDAKPRLVLSDNIRKIENLADIKGAFERIEPADISLAGYVSHPAIKAPMAA
jgi:thymidylate synthase